METIDPNALRELRKRNNLTRQALSKEAKVSVRTISRIERSDNAHPARANTLRRLAEFFDVSADVLTGAEPVPLLLQIVGSTQDYSPERLRVYREGKGLSRAELAHKSGVSERQIARLETSRKMAHRSTLDALAGALGIDVRMLEGDREAQEPDSVQFGAKVSPLLRLAYDLVGQRYGPTRKEIIELAPLLFVLAAEGCLAWRRRRLKEVEKALDRLEELGNENQLYFARYPGRIEDGYFAEEKSIAKNDLLGDLVRTDETVNSMGFSVDDLFAVTPFADYLRKQAKDLEIGGIVDFFPETDMDATVGFETIWGAEPYIVCYDHLAKLTGDRGTRSGHWRRVMSHSPKSPRISWRRMPRTLASSG